MGSSSRSKGSAATSRQSIMTLKGKSSYYSYAVLGICIACLPLLVVAHRDQRLVRRQSRIEPDLHAAESQNAGHVQRAPLQAMESAPVPTAAVPPSASAVAPPPSPPLAAAASDASYSTFPSPFTFPKSDLAGSPSYAPRYAIPPVNPWREDFPFEMTNFRRRAQDDEPEHNPEDDYKPSESKRKKHAPSVFKRVSSLIRNTGKAIVGAPSYIFKRYRGSWKRIGGSGGGGGKKKKGGWKSHSSSDKNKDDGYGGWEDVEPTGGYDHEPSQYPSDKGGWGSGKGYSKGGYDSNERRSDKDNYNYRDYKDREYRERDRDYRDDYRDYDNYRSPPPSSSPPASRGGGSRDRQKYNSGNAYREETHYDDYDGRRTTAYYGGPGRKSPPPPSSKRPYVGSGGSGGSGKSGSGRYDDEY